MNINSLRANLVQGGARNSQFSVIITNPINPVADIKVPFLTKATQIPSFNLGTIGVPYFGRSIPFPGDRTWEDWTTTVINDETFDIRNALEEWNNAINSFRGNTATLGSAPANYVSQGTVTQYGKDDSVLRVYQFNNIWPKIISSIDLAWDTTDTIEEFQVIWGYDDIEIVGGKTGNAGGV